MSKSKKTILIIDDEVSIRKLIRDTLSHNYWVLEAENYDEAVAIAEDRRGEIDMLLVDVSLPGKNGFQTAKALRNIDPNVKLLFMSGPVGAELTKYYGVPTTDVHFLPKPFSTAELLERVTFVLKWSTFLAARSGL